MCVCTVCGQDEDETSQELQGSAGTYGERETAVIFLTGLSAIFNPGLSNLPTVSDNLV